MTDLGCCAPRRKGGRTPAVFGRAWLTVRRDGHGRGDDRQRAVRTESLEGSRRRARRRVGRDEFVRRRVAREVFASEADAHSHVVGRSGRSCSANKKRKSFLISNQLSRRSTLLTSECAHAVRDLSSGYSAERDRRVLAVSTSPYAASLISLSLSSSQPILRFGSFTLKSGRQSPYFFNFGLFNSGTLLLALTEAYTDAILDAFPRIGTAEATADDPTVLFGPAYKGIPLVAAIVTELARRGRDVGFSYNRKEAKNHGEGGSIVGTPLDGKRVLIVDDVITAGTAIREAHKIVEAEGGKTVGIVEALDREEKGQQGDLSTVQEVEQALGVKVTSVVKMRDIVSWLKEQGKDDECKAMQEYRDKWGVV